MQQGRQGKARQKWGCSQCFRRLFSLSLHFLVLVHMSCALDNELVLLLLLIIMMIPNSASSFDRDPGRVKWSVCAPVAAAVVMQKYL